MARTGRIQSKIGVYHILLRGMNELFLSDSDFTEFVDILKKYSKLGILSVFSYTLLKDRIHLVIETNAGVGIAMKPICTSYARYFNRTYSRDGKLFYDRLKSEPINSREELRNVVAFVNAISADSDYPYSSLSASGRELCIPGTLTRAELLETKVSEIFMEDYNCLSREEIERYIIALCGTNSKDFTQLSSSDQKNALALLTKKRWIAKNRLYELLGINRPRPDSTAQAEAPAKEPENNRNLSVWLL